jgi:Rho GTPase-activating protein RGD1
MLLDRVKQKMHSSKELANFIKKRAAIEEEYGKSLLKLSQSCTDTVDKGDGKQG